MFCAIVLKDFLHNLLVPIDYIQDLTIKDMYNGNMDVKKLYTVFYAPQIVVGKELKFIAADFDSQFQTTFDIQESTGLYHAYILSAFGKNCLFL